MEATSISDKQLDELHKKLDHIFQMAESLGIYRQEVLCSKSSAADKINFIKKLLKKGQLRAYPTVNHASQSFKEQQEELSFNSSISINDMIDHFNKLLIKETSQGRDFCYSPFGQSSNKKFSLSMTEDVTKESARYLLVSNGCTICLLDLKLSKGSKPISKDDDVPLLPKIASLNLIDEQLPVSVGLFRLGSDAYMIGGLKFPTNFEPPRWLFSKKNRSTFDVYKSFCQLHRLKGTSIATYRLYIADDGTLCPSECNDILKLKSPKLCPIVDEVDGKIHVFDSTPSVCVNPDIDWMFSHEVFECDNMFNWRFSKSPTTGPPLDYLIKSHVVVGHRIFAVISRTGPLLVFDVMKNKWEAHDDPIPQRVLSRFHVYTVWDILLLGYARCVEEIRLGEVSYYVLFALLHAEGDGLRYSLGAAAYLVTSTGHIVCMQELRDFFKAPVRLFTVNRGTVIKAEKEGKTMCAIVNGAGIWEGGSCNGFYLFCNTFIVELLTGAASKVGDILERGCLLGAARQEKLVRVDIVDKCIYKTDEEDGDLPDFVDMQACFL